MGKLDLILQRGMRQVGKGIEQLAGLGQSLRQRQNPSAQSSYEFPLPWNGEALREILLAAERRELGRLLPNLEQKTVLHLIPHPQSNYLDLLQKKLSGTIVAMDDGSFSSITPEENATPWVRAHLESPPFRDESFDAVLLPSALNRQPALKKTMGEMTRCLKLQGRLFLSLPHPFLEQALQPEHGFRKNFSALFDQFRNAGLIVEEVREGFFHRRDLRGATKALFAENERWEGLPLLLFFRAISVKKGKK